jgi:SAM-dependent methyltransferase
MALTPYQQLQQIKDQYNSIGFHFAQTRKKRMWAEVLPFVQKIKPKMRVLDVGCGNGRLLPELSGIKVYYTGLDFSEVLIEKARKRFPKRRFLVRDVTNAKDWENLGKYDAVFCLGVLHHIPDRNRQHDLVQQMYKHTKQGGFVLISIWNLWNLRWWKLHLKQLAKKIDYGNLSFIWVPYKVSDGKKVVRQVARFCKAFIPGDLLSLVKQVGYTVKVFYYAKRGRTKMSILKGENFLIYAEK